MFGMSPKIIIGSPKSLDSIEFNDQCDCACAYTPCAEYTTADITGFWRAASTEIFSLPDGWQGVFAPGGIVPLAVLNRPAHALWSRFQQNQNIETLDLSKEETQAVLDMASAGLLQPLAVPELQPLDAAQGKPSTSNLQLAAWLHLTDRCNLRCSYCYLPHVREDMTPGTGRAVVDATFRSAAALESEFEKLERIMMLLPAETRQRWFIALKKAWSEAETKLQVREKQHASLLALLPKLYMKFRSGEKAKA